jgi:hypothetical protein
MTNWGEWKETRRIITTMIQHDRYHAGEINICAPYARAQIGGPMILATYDSQDAHLLRVR